MRVKGRSVVYDGRSLWVEGFAPPIVAVYGLSHRQVKQLARGVIKRAQWLKERDQQQRQNQEIWR